MPCYGFQDPIYKEWKKIEIIIKLLIMLTKTWGHNDHVQQRVQRCPVLSVERSLISILVSTCAIAPAL